MTDKFGKFAEAIRDLSRQTELIVPPVLHTLREAAFYALTTGQRFYLPAASWVLPGRVVDEDTKRLCRLPYDNISLLTESSVGPDETRPKRNGWTIAVAFEPTSEVNNRFRIIDPAKCPPRCFLLLVLLGFPPDPWMVLPFCVACEMTVGEKGFKTHISDFGLVKAAVLEHVMEEMSDEIGGVQNLCVMLNLHNVKTKQVTPPAALNARRVKNHKTPLPNYHVLVVDGERWDDTDDANLGSGSPKRSHYRRGHIRHLDENRAVWVRATCVQGRADGAVLKDYVVGRNRNGMSPK